MNKDDFDSALRACFVARFTMDEQFRAKTSRMLYEKNERQSSFLLCLIQIAMCVLSICMIIGTFFLSRGVLIFLLAYIVTGNIISVAVVLLLRNNNQRVGWIL